ncbi:MAG: chemotaxis protein CheX [Sandaracinus sp.]|nr:chemotaxis protein CheX [Sandaracinus sp.]MCB9616708.1 chemotaxis protein CheX [Sandaracinus sp.]MCB9632504.1 chemotaxis protein CheX [Sandaracinus sp.]
MHDLLPWFEATDAAASELADSFGFTPWHVDGPSERPPVFVDARGGLVSIVGEAKLLQVAVIVDAGTEERLAARMLDMPAEELDGAMVADGLCELANILAGSLKARTTDLVEGAKLGLPVHVRGVVEPPSGASYVYLTYRWEDRPVAVLLLERAPG